VGARMTWARGWRGRADDVGARMTWARARWWRRARPAN